VNDGRSIPVSGADWQSIKSHGTLGGELRGEEEAGWARSDHQHCGLTACVWTHRRGLIQTIGRGGACNPSHLLAEERLRYAREDSAASSGKEERPWHRVKRRYGECETHDRTRRKRDAPVPVFACPTIYRPDMYNSLSPDAFRNIFESAPVVRRRLHSIRPDRGSVMDSTGWECWSATMVRCQSKGSPQHHGGDARVQDCSAHGNDAVLPIV